MLGTDIRRTKSGAVGDDGGRREDRGQAGKGGLLSSGVAQRGGGPFRERGHGFPCSPRARLRASCSRCATLGRSGRQADPGSNRLDPSRDGTCATLHQLRNRPGQAAAIERTRPAGASCYASRRQGASRDSHWPYRQPGSAPYNLDLSQRRAAAVYLWLIQHGVDSGRLRSDGRGLMEPIADNTSESGRALNRRVEVKSSN